MSKNFFKNKVILITGGTGSFGKALVKHLLEKKYPLRKIIIFSRDELKQSNFQNTLSSKHNKLLRFFIGDVRDIDRLRTAFEDVDYVIHAAALKQVPAAEYNPIEFIKTNVLGTQNIISSCLEKKVKAAILLSTDKASSPINLYGATKLCADKIFIASNNFYGKSTFSVVRYGNVNSSRGSVIPYFTKQAKSGTLTITEKNMTRFSLSLKDSIELVIFSLKNLLGGEILIPKIKSYKIMDLARAVCANCKIKTIGKRPGEKLHEELISQNDDSIKIQMKDKFILINKNRLKQYTSIIKKFNGKILADNFSFTSDKNSFLKIEEIKKIIKDYSKEKNLI